MGIEQALQQLQALQAQQQLAANTPADMSDADLLAVPLPHMPHAPRRGDVLEAVQVQDRLRLTAGDPLKGSGKRLATGDPDPATPHVTHEELKGSLSALSSRLQDGFNATLGRATAELNSLVSSSVSESLQD